MDQQTLINAAAAYMQARPCPFTMLPTRTLVGRGKAYPPAHVLAPLVAAHVPLAAALIVQNMAARGYTSAQCPIPAPFAIAHIHRQQYAGELLAFVGYIPAPQAAGFTWPANAAAVLECWLAAGDNMVRAMQYMATEKVDPLENAPAIITQLLYNIDEYIESEYDECDVIDVSEPRV